VTWHPSEGEIINDKIAVRNGWMPKPGARTFNTYIPPLRYDGKPARALRWVRHWRRLYPNDYKRIIAWLAHRVQYPGIKPSFCIVLAGDPGIGKDTLLCPIRDAVGPWNCEEIQLHNLGSAFNDYQGCVFLRISEARDSGDGTMRGRIDRYTLNDRMKPLLAAPPETFRLNRKWEPEYQAFNVCGVLITTNHPDALYLTPDDRRYDVVLSQRVAADFTASFFTEFYRWYYQEGGIGHVIAYLRALDLSKFNPHAAPPKTEAFWGMADADLNAEDAELEDALDALGKTNPNDKTKIIRPDALTLGELAAKAPGADWLRDNKKNRIVVRRLREAGYMRIRNPDTPSMKGLWLIKGKYSSIYARKDLNLEDALKAAQQLKCRIDGFTVVGGIASSSSSKAPGA
jgi:hypothetical protein